jgi:hypothetical protein
MNGVNGEISRPELGSNHESALSVFSYFLGTSKSRFRRFALVDVSVA